MENHTTNPNSPASEMTIRAEIASRAMQGMISDVLPILSTEETELIAAQAIQFTDALIAELNKEK